MANLARNSLNVFSKRILSKHNLIRRPPSIAIRFLSDVSLEGETSSIHFRATNTPHPLASGTNNLKASKVTVTHVVGSSSAEKQKYEQILGDHIGLQQNHIWTPVELEEKLTVLYHHKPQTISDLITNTVVYGLYHSFNAITGYKHVNPSVQSIEWRLLVLESVAGVPGFVAAGFRHFRSLRTLQRDHGWIATLLEEAENERMHLLLCLNKFNAGIITRTMVITAQMILVPVLMGVYAVHPRSMHRFVGYLEETACKTYVNIIAHVETPGTELNLAWKDMEASDMAKGYYKLPPDAKWVDTLKCIVSYWLSIFLLLITFFLYFFSSFLLRSLFPSLYSPFFLAVT
jgi:hypothetical protein